jgi:putative tricarboxylic transport membrane protein
MVGSDAASGAAADNDGGEFVAAADVVMALPATLPHTVIGVAFLLSISVGVGYGNSIPAILMGIPGNPAAILTVIDGHKLHKE